MRLMQQTICQTSYRQRIIEYETHGRKGVCPPVILIHGFTEDRRIWEKIIRPLSEKYRFILPDLPGSGQSEFNPQLRSMEDFAGAIEAIRQAEQADRVVVIGHSMGGYISMAFAEICPGNLAGIGLFHSTARPDSPERKAAREKNQDFIQRNGAAHFVRQSLPGLYFSVFHDENPEEIEKQTARYANFSPETLVLYLEAMKNRPDRTDVLKKTPVPVLFLLGEEDKIITVGEGLALCHLPRISYFHNLPRTAHMGMVENPNLCISCVDRFLDQFTW